MRNLKYAGIGKTVGLRCHDLLNPTGNEKRNRNLQTWHSGAPKDFCKNFKREKVHPRNKGKFHEVKPLATNPKNFGIQMPYIGKNPLKCHKNTMKLLVPRICA
jgi:hypothetical protein